MNIEEYKQAPTSKMMALLLTADTVKTKVPAYFSDAKKLVCMEQGKCIGITEHTFSDNIFKLKNTAVATNHHGKKIAKQLIAEVKRSAKELGGTRKNNC